jgi:hypothetical protein
LDVCISGVSLRCRGRSFNRVSSARFALLVFEQLGQCGTPKALHRCNRRVRLQRCQRNPNRARSFGLSPRVHASFECPECEVVTAVRTNLRGRQVRT